MSGELSTKNHRITIIDLRPCSTCRSNSQANFYYYALNCRKITRTSLLFTRLRYLLGGDRPSQTTRYNFLGLVIACFKEWYFKV